jgi:OmpA family
MKTTLGFLILFITFSSSLFSQNIIKQSIYFDSDKSNIRTSELQTLQTVIDSFSKVKDYAFQLSGNTDADGSDTYNINLSDKRVGAIKAFLLSKGIDESKIQAVAQGENKPIADNQTEKGKQSNRRVDIELVSINPVSHKSETPATSVSEQKFPFEKGKNYSIKRLYQEFNKEEESFEVIAGTETVLKGKKGTIIKIPATTFDVAEGTKVEIKLQEFYKTNDIVKANLTTFSKDKMLETNGMIHIEATANGQPVNAKENYLLMMPKKVASYNERNDMQLFEGVATKQAQNVDWRVQQPNFSFLFNAANIIGQRAEMNMLRQSLKDTCGCAKMLVWRIDSLHIKQLKKEGIGTDNLEEFIASDLRPKGYNFDHVNKDTMSGFCRLLAAWAAPDYSWHRRIPWKFKHQVANGDMYAQYRASSYDSLLINLDRYIQLSHDAEKAMRAGKSQATSQFNVFETKQLNWINCDRFYNISESSLTAVKTGLRATPNVEAKLIFTKLNSIMNANNKEGELCFDRIPIGEPAMLIVMKLENGISYLATQQVIVGKTAVKLKFKAMTPDEIDKTLAAN